MDDFWLYLFLPDSSPKLQLPSFEEGMKHCRDFFTHRNATQADAIPSNAIQDQSKWDEDLFQMSESELDSEMKKILRALQSHHDKPLHQRTLDDDRTLYSILPEKIPADFRLPSENEFLGDARAPHAGCPSFWRSHQNCPTTTHNLHAWGPCKKK